MKTAKKKTSKSKPTRKPPAFSVRESERSLVEGIASALPDQVPYLWYQALSHLVANGTEFHGFTPSRTNPVTDRYRKVKRPKRGECFYNALMFCLANPKAEYWEGKACAGNPWTVDHAWVVLDGKVIDFTWEGMRESEECYYLGCHIPTAFVSKLANERGEAGSVLCEFLEEKNVKP